MSLEILLKASWETFAMVCLAGLVGSLIGIPLGILLHVLERNLLRAPPALYRVVNLAINAWRSIPFIILLVALIPLTRLIVGTSIGTAAAMIPLIAAVVPFIARLVEGALSEVDPGLLEAAYSLGASPGQAMRRVVLPESLPGIVNGVTLAMINLVSYSAMAGCVGGGGLGDLAIRYGYQRFDPYAVVAAILILLVYVQALQVLGEHLSRRLRH